MRLPFAFSKKEPAPTNSPAQLQDVEEKERPQDFITKVLREMRSKYLDDYLNKYSEEQKTQLPTFEFTLIEVPPQHPNDSSQLYCQIPDLPQMPYIGTITTDGIRTIVNYFHDIFNENKSELTDLKISEWEQSNNNSQQYEKRFSFRCTLSDLDVIYIIEYMGERYLSPPKSRRTR